jgi:alkylhydroperoxidase family enzyme
MAFLTFDAIGSAPGIAAAPATAAATARLSPLEWSVVALSEHDPVSSLRTPGRIATAIRGVFRRSVNKLADERLEALRRLAVLAWRRGPAVPAREIEACLTAGFTPAQLAVVTASIAAARRREDRR